MSTATEERETTDESQNQFKAEVSDTLADAGVLANGDQNAPQGDQDSAAAAVDAHEESTPREGTTDAAKVGDQEPPPDPTSAAAQLADWQRLIQQQEGVCAIGEAQWQGAKESAKEAKATYELAVKLLRRLIRESSDPQRKLPFNEAEKPAATSSEIAGQEPSPQAEPAADPNAWKSESIDVLGLTPRIIKALTEAGLTDLGKIADYSAANDGLNGITGIGPAAREQISDAMEKYWLEHPRPDAPPELEVFDGEEAEDDDDEDEDLDDGGEEE